MELSRRLLLSGLGFAAATPAVAKVSQVKDLQAAVDEAGEGDGVLRLGAGEFGAARLRITKPLCIEGIPGRTVLRTTVVIDGAAEVSLAGLSFTNESDGALVSAVGARDLTIENCRIIGGGRGIVLERCSGAIRNSVFRNQRDAALFALDSLGLEISGNTVSDIGTNGIMVWSSDKREDGTLVSNNRISRIASVPGDTGQTGNGVSIFRAGNVVVSGNRISDCAYSAIRNNAGDSCQIIGNSASRLGETAIYCEFAFLGAVIANNIVEDAGNGVSITNFDVGGRLATCSGNVVRRCKGFGIFAEAETAITGNAVEAAIDFGIALGWSFASKTLTAANNTVVGCGRGITYSVAEGAEPPMIVNNRIAASRKEAIAAMTFHDLAGGEPPPGAVIAGNMIS
jgi:uncharacterized secreted repeat protein (TIGR03808 family)